MEANAQPVYSRVASSEGGAPTSRVVRRALAAALCLCAVSALVLVAPLHSPGRSRQPSTGAVESQHEPEVVILAEDKKAKGKCSDKFVIPPEPKTATELNGAVLEEVCFMSDTEHHVFIIGDWGGLVKDGKLAAASHLNHRWNKTQNFQFIWPTDTDAQKLVANQMAKRAPKSKPEYILNMGDNFYWGGINDYCDAKDITDMYNGGGSVEYKKEPYDQFKEVFEDIYGGAGIDGLMWLGILGNHDWGGWRYDMGWDQAIGYTWSKAKTAQGRWLTPSLYYFVKVKYPDFSVDYWFLDTNVWDALPIGEKPPHNICGPHNPGGTANKLESEPRSCGGQGGPKSMTTCMRWFEELWVKQKDWMAKLVKKSTAEWRVVVTHFPPYWGKEDWMELAPKHEIDAMITGHRHSQNMHCEGDVVAKIWAEDPHSHEMNDFLDPTAWVVSGGGGGITSEHVPDTEGDDDQYGFVDMTLTKKELTFVGISHGGKERKRMVVSHSYSHGGVNEVVGSKPRCQVTCRGKPCEVELKKSRHKKEDEEDDGKKSDEKASKKGESSKDEEAEAAAVAAEADKEAATGIATV